MRRFGHVLALLRVLALPIAGLLAGCAGAGKPEIEPWLREDLARWARDHVLQQATESGEERVAGDSVVVDAFLEAQLDGAGAREGIVYVRRDAAGGIREYWLAVFDVALPDTPRMLVSTCTHSEVRVRGYCEVLDLDDDGRAEVLIVGDGRGRASSLLRVLAWDGRDLRDMVWGPDCGQAYFPADVDGDGRREIVAVARGTGDAGAGPAVVRLLRKGGGGYYREAPAGPAVPEVLGRTFAQVAAGRTPWRPAIDLPILLDAMRGHGVQPGSLRRVQRDLEARYRESRRAGPGGGAAEIVNGMGWPGNTRAFPFLRRLARSTDPEDPRAAAVRALATIGDREFTPRLLTLLDRQLQQPVAGMDSEFVLALAQSAARLGDDRGVETVCAVARNVKVDKRVRRDLLLWVLGRLNAKALPTLLALARDSGDVEIRRLAAMGLEAQARRDPAFPWPKAAELLQAGDPKVRAAAAVALGHTGSAESIPALLASLAREAESLPKRQMIHALTRLQAGDAVALFRRLAREERDVELRLALWRGLDGLGATLGREDLAPGVPPDASQKDVVQWLYLLGRHPAEGLLPEVTRIACSGLGREDDEAARAEAVKVLGRIGTPGAAQGLRVVLSSVTSGWVRSRAALALGEAKDPEAEMLLLRVLKIDPDASVRLRAAGALVALGTERARRAVIGNLNRGLSPDPAAYVGHVVAFGGNHAVEALATVLDERLRRPPVERDDIGYCWELTALAVGLHDLGDRRGVEHLVRWARPDEAYVQRIAAIRSLGAVGTPAARACLRKASEDPDRSIRIAAIEALTGVE